MDAQRQMEMGLAKGITISGDLTAQEDLAIHGRIDGQVTVPDHHVIVAPTANVRAKIVAHTVTIRGFVDGTIIASERVVLEPTANVRGHLMTPMLSLVEGAQFNGTVDPTRTEAAMHVAKYRQKQGEGTAG